MIAYYVATKVLGTEIFPQHNIVALISGITFIVLFSHEKPLRWKEINTHSKFEYKPLEEIKKKKNQIKTYSWNSQQHKNMKGISCSSKLRLMLDFVIYLLIFHINLISLPEGNF